MILDFGLNPLWLPLGKGEKRAHSPSMSQRRASPPGETDALPLNATAPRILPLCKGELEGVVGKLKVKS